MMRLLLVAALFGIGKKKESIQSYINKIREYREAEAELYLEISGLFYDEEDIEGALQSLENSLKIYEELGDKERQAYLLDILGDIHLQVRHVKKALKAFQESFNLYSSINSPLKEEMYQKIQEAEAMGEAIELVKQKKAGEGPYAEKPTLKRERQAKEGKTEREEEMEKDLEIINSITNKLDDVIALMGDPHVYEYQKMDDPLNNVKEAYDMAHEIGDTKGEAILLLIMGDIYLKNKSTKEAMEYFDKALKKFLEINDDKGEAISMLLIGTVYFIEGDMENTVSNYKDSIHIFRTLKNKDAEDMAKELMNIILEE